MRRIARGASTLVLGALLSSCSLLERFLPAAAPEPAPVSVAEATGKATSAEELIAYLGRLKSLNEAALNAEVARQRQVAQRDTRDVTRVKVAIALTLSQAEEADILAIVDPLARKEARGDPDVRAMASFLQGIATERRRLKESAAAAGVRVRDAQRARETEKQRADALQERAAQLQQKLDALTDLEKSLSDRTTPPR